jgi:hypothetical protein
MTRFEEGKAYIGHSRVDSIEFVCTRRTETHVWLKSKEIAKPCRCPIRRSKAVECAATSIYFIEATNRV